MNKRSYKLAVLFLIILMSVGVAGCGKEETSQTEVVKKKVKIQQVSKQEQVSSKLVLNSTVVPKEYTLIRSLVSGTIEFLAPVGSEVRVGQPLFSIRNEGIENNYFNTLRSFQQTEITTSQRVQQAELSLNSAKARLDLARLQYDSVVSQTKQSLKTSEDSAALAYSSAYNTINQILTNYNSTSFENPTYTLKDILTSDQALRSDTSFLFNKMVDNFNDLPTNADRDDLESSLELMHQSLLSIKEFVDSTSILLQRAIANENYSSAAIATDKGTNSLYQASINGHLSAIISSSSNLENAKINNKISIDSAGSQLDLAMIEYNNIEIALQNAKDGASLEKSISQSQLDSSAYNYNNLTLASPFSGTILSHSVKAGEQISVGQELIEVGNLAIIEMSTDVDVNFAKAIKLGDQVMIDGTYKGFVSKVDPIGDLQSGKVSVTVQSQEAGQALVAGSTAEIEFTLIYSDINTIVAPIKSVTIEASGNYVFVVGEDGKVLRKNVNLGQIYSDQVSIISGLEEGDKLILLDGVFVAVDDEVEIVE